MPGFKVPEESCFKCRGRGEKKGEKERNLTQASLEH